MTVDTDALVAWLREQLDEEAAAASQVVRDYGDYSWSLIVGFITEEDPYDQAKDAADHVARWDPARVLAEVAAKRARIDLLAQVAAGQMVLGPSHQNQDVEAAFAVRLLLLEAQPYAGRPGFKPEWRLT